MTAWAVEMLTGPWAGRAVVRAAGGMTLHVVVEGAQVPAAAMFTVPVECRPDAESAPGVRPWTGPVDEGRLCAPCLQALRRVPGTESNRQSSGAVAAAPLSRPEPDGRPLRWSSWGAVTYVS